MKNQVLEQLLKSGNEQETLTYIEQMASKLLLSDAIELYQTLLNTPRTSENDLCPHIDLQVKALKALAFHIYPPKEKEIWLRYAAGNNFFYVVKALAEVANASAELSAPLHFAIQYDHWDCAELLLPYSCPEDIMEFLTDDEANGLRHLQDKIEATRVKNILQNELENDTVVNCNNNQSVKIRKL